MKNYPVSRTLFFTLTLALPFFANAQNVGIQFLQNDFPTAKNRAATEEKLILVKFTAKWCLPCRVMDEYVWSDPTLVSAIEKNAIAVSADIENFDGLALKQQFLVESLPTVLILNACGETLVRFETSCSASQILERFNYFNTAENRFCPVDPASVVAVQDLSGDLSTFVRTDSLGENWTNLSDAQNSGDEFWLSEPVVRTEVLPRNPIFSKNRVSENELPEH